MYKWMDYIIGAECNTQVAEYFGEAPGNPQVVRAGRQAIPTTATSSMPKTRTYFEGRLRTGRRPMAECLDGRADDLQGLRGLDRGLDRDQAAERSAIADRGPRGRHGRRGRRACPSASDRVPRTAADSRPPRPSAAAAARGVAAPPSAGAPAACSWRRPSAGWSSSTSGRSRSCSSTAFWHPRRVQRRRSSPS